MEEAGILVHRSEEDFRKVNNKSIIIIIINVVVIVVIVVVVEKEMNGNCFIMTREGATLACGNL